MQNGCQPRITASSLSSNFMVNDCEFAVDPDYIAVDGIGRQQVLACMVYKE